ncbi:nicotinate-nucleotide adenylyltransferase [Spirulina sp. CS-785/01]|uniref:nicotinate-nucleotide adenylyltransferase n=1 Tax=Spirulina sp. CS-785/01 TaxID=3021716 RepID=UPI002330F6C8|nr:nicotinate-nucleotide adenylyltransferase [Spirulina sp. CS-785/01]MDB9313180.1 nicotinate-nucleotide adenylyltransferase [Spirulina sp. CS-785/01]
MNNTPSPTKIALFGTSADPPTAGHQAILRWLAERYDLVAVWASDNPFKSHQTSLDHRMMMLRLVIREIQPPYHNILLRRDLSSSRSIETVEQAKVIWGEETEFVLVVGSDLAGQVTRWYKAQELLKQVQLLIVPRPGYSVQHEDIQGLEEMGANYAIADFQAPNVSSTAYRDRGDRTVVIPLVEDYIHQQQLYAS